nr:hypothetical protein [Moraxella osloensis]
MAYPSIFFNREQVLSQTLIQNSKNLSNEQITAAQQQLSQLTQALKNLTQTVSTLSQTTTTSVTDVNTQVNAALTTLQAAVSEASDQAVATSQTTLQSIPSQIKQVSEQLMQDTQQTMIAHQRQLNRLYRLGLTAWVVTALGIFAAIGLFGYHYYLGKQVYQAQQQLDTLQHYISRTPLEVKAFSMMDIYPNKHNPDGVIIMPKNQLTAYWTKSEANNKILLLTPPDNSMLPTPAQQNRSSKQK